MPTLKRLGNNMTEVHSNNAILFFSYDTCVALESFDDYNIYVDQCPVWGQESGISRTTRRHINKWLEGRGFKYLTHDKFRSTMDSLS